MDLTASLKDWKGAGIWEVPKILLDTFGSIEAAAFIYRVAQGVATTSNPQGLFYIQDRDFARALFMDYEPFRYLRRKVEAARLVSHTVKLAEGATCPHYSINLPGILAEIERVRAGGSPRFVKGKHRRLGNLAEVSHSEQNTGLAEFSHTGLGNLADSSHSIDNTGLRPARGNVREVSQTQESKGVRPARGVGNFEEVSQTITTPVIKTPGAVWTEVMEKPLPPGAGELIEAAAIEDLGVWRLTLLGWKANPRWNNDNVDGQISRYRKNLREGAYTNAPGQTAPQPVPERQRTQEEDAGRTSLRSSIYAED